MKEKGMTTITLKKINREKVYQYIYQQKETSKLRIVRDRTWDFKRYVSYCSREFIWKCSCNRDN